MINSKIKKLIIWAIIAVFLVVIGYIGYFSIPHFNPIPIAYILKNPDSYKGKPIAIEGNPVLLSSLDTKWGKTSFYALEDSTGKIPVSMNTVGWELINEKIGVVGELGDVCVHGVYNATSDSWVCDKKELGIIS